MKSRLQWSIGPIVAVGALMLGCAASDPVRPDAAPPPPPPASGQLFYSTLDGPAAVTSPAVGNGGAATISTTPADDFVPARVSNGLRADAIGERVLLPQMGGAVQNVEHERGTIEFWYQPFYDHDDSNKYAIAGTGGWKADNSTRGSIHLGKHNASNQNMIFLIMFDANGVRWEHNVQASDYAWNAGDWVLIRFTWDMTVPAGEPNMRLYLNGVELPLTGQVSRGPQPTLDESSSERLYIGSRDTAGDIPPAGVYDEFRIWAEAIPPS